MSQFTKNAIIRSFLEILNEKPFDKITVTDIVERCGVNRNTFYYYYQDIYALLDEVFQNERDAILSKYPVYDSWQEGFLQATKFAFENKQAIFHIYNSIRKDTLEQYLYDVTSNAITAFVRKQAEGLPVTEENIRLLADFYTFGLMGFVFSWLNHGMKTDPKEIIKNAGTLLDGNIRYTLEKSCKHDN